MAWELTTPQRKKFVTTTSLSQNGVVTMESITKRLEATISMSVPGLEPSPISGRLHCKLKSSLEQQGLYFAFWEHIQQYHRFSQETL